MLQATGVGSLTGRKESERTPTPESNFYSPLADDADGEDEVSRSCPVLTAPSKLAPIFVRDINKRRSPEPTPLTTLRHRVVSKKGSGVVTAKHKAKRTNAAKPSSKWVQTGSIEQQRTLQNRMQGAPQAHATSPADFAGTTCDRDDAAGSQVDDVILEEASAPELDGVLPDQDDACSENIDFSEDRSQDTPEDNADGTMSLGAGTKFGVRFEKLTNKNGQIELSLIKRLFRLLDARNCHFWNFEECGIGGIPDDSADIQEIEHLTSSELMQFVDYGGIPWGRKTADKNWRYSFSFYIESTTLSSWRDFRTDAVLMDFLKTNEWFVRDHQLHESQVVNVAYVIGKHPDKTHRPGLAEDIQEYLRDNDTSHDDLAIAVVHSHVPLDIGRLPILAVQCGISQRAQIDAVLNKNIPHPTIDLISAQLRRTNPTAYDSALNDHMNCRDNVTAAILTNVPIRFFAKLKADLLSQRGENGRPMILDLEPTSSSADEGKYYATLYKEYSQETRQIIQSIVTRFNEAHHTTVVVRDPVEAPRSRRSACTATYVSRHIFTKKWDGIQSYAKVATTRMTQLPPPRGPPPRGPPASPSIQPAVPPLAAGDPTTQERFRKLERLLDDSAAINAALRQDVDKALAMLATSHEEHTATLLHTRNELKTLLETSKNETRQQFEETRQQFAGQNTKFEAFQEEMRRMSESITNLQVSINALRHPGTGSSNETSSQQCAPPAMDQENQVMGAVPPHARGQYPMTPLRSPEWNSCTPAMQSYPASHPPAYGPMHPPMHYPMHPSPTQPLQTTWSERRAS